jgi:hypothetical protein
MVFDFLQIFYQVWLHPSRVSVIDTIHKNLDVVYYNSSNTHCQHRHAGLAGYQAHLLHVVKTDGGRFHEKKYQVGHL